jgi:hypothetical protein
MRFTHEYFQVGREPEIRDRVARDRDELVVATSRRRRDLIVNVRRERCVVRRAVPQKAKADEVGRAHASHPQGGLSNPCRHRRLDYVEESSYDRS